MWEDVVVSSYDIGVWVGGERIEVGDGVVEIYVLEVFVEMFVLHRVS